MVKSKAWDWSTVEKDNACWLSPSKELYYLAEIWKQKGYKKFLDMGCGMGRNSVFMAKNGFDVYAFDLSDESVKRTEENAKKSGVSVNVCVADMLCMPYADGSFDCLFAMYVISHTDTAGFIKVVGEMERVLKPGGEAYFTVLDIEAPVLKNGDNEVIDAHTVVFNEDGPEKGVPHFAIGADETEKFFSRFDVVDVERVARITEEYGTRPHFHILVRKKH
ncbi:MAG: class I SAM-dependent methyltransferase [Clostridia bacterium]|nr:class I SAM-dependent methyltransferase [Clostridia bacterium]